MTRTGTSGPLVKCRECDEWLPLTRAAGPVGRRWLTCVCGATVLPIRAEHEERKSA